MAEVSHILSARQFDTAQISDIFERTDAMYETFANDRRELATRHLGYQLSTTFYEPSTRTRKSFESGAQQIGMDVITTESAKQLSVHAARAIEQRFRDLFGGHFPALEEILGTDVEALRGLGFSYAKGRYVLDLAQHIVDGKVKFDRFDALSNEEILAELIPVKGVGEWTVHMFLMFCMGRLDVLPVGDLGIRNGVRALYGFKDAPTPDQIRQISKKNHWHPYESVASWYVWRSLNNAPAL